jgi:hypothetical protein
MKRLFLFALCPLLFTLPTQAAFVYSGLQNIGIPTDFNGVYIDIDNAATFGSDFAGADINPFFGGSGFYNNADFQPVRTGTNYDDAIVRLPSGALISAASTFSSGVGISGSPNNHMGAGGNQFSPGTEGFLGFKFFKNNASGPFYGWVRLVFTNNTAGGLIKDWVYDDSGAPILAGAPEPSRVIFLMLGILALAQRRRRC